MAHLLCAARPPRRGGSGSGRSRYQYDTPITWLRKAIVNRTAVDGRASRWRGWQHWEGRGLRQATSALAVSRLSNEVVVATDVASSRLILSHVPGAILQSYADAILGPLDASDQPEQLLSTLSTFLESNGAYEVAAQALHVHRHTMRNRIARIEHIAGKRLDTAQDRFELWLALRVRDLTRVEGALVAN